MATPGRNRYYLALICLFALPSVLKAQHPNILVILADDLGWADLGCYGNRTVSTPHLDRLAGEGMLFTDAYAPAPICSPSRAAFLTGKSPARLQFEFVSKPSGSKAPNGTVLVQPPFPRDLPLKEVSLAEMLPPVYTSGFFGKWHLTQENDRYLGWGDRFGPLQQGFDQGSESRGSHPYGFGKAEQNTFGTYSEGEYPADRLTEEAIAFLRSTGNRPFLLYYSMYYVHTPVRTRCKWLYEKYRRLFGPGASGKQIHYASFIATMDAYVGQLLQALEETGQRENTVVIFLSDNGGHPGYADNGPLRGSYWSLYEGGVRVSMIDRWPKGIQPGSVCSIPVIGMDLFPTLVKLSGAVPARPLKQDGVDLNPLFRNPAGTGWERNTLFWHFPYYHPDFVNTKPQSAIRLGNHKLIYFYEEERSELYDLATDPGETQDLALRMAGKVRRMEKNLLEELRRVNARFPVKNQ